jgi:hypothetical protein
VQSLSFSLIKKKDSRHANRWMNGQDGRLTSLCTLSHTLKRKAIKTSFIHFMHKALLPKSLYSKGTYPSFVDCMLKSNSEMSMAFPLTLTLNNI